MMQLGPMARRAVCTRLNCASCNARLELIVECSACHRRQPLSEDLSYFSLIAPPFKPSLQVDQARLRDAYLLAMKRCHPDRATNGCERVTSQAWSAWATKAYSCLKDPLCRAQHCYQLVCKGANGGDGGDCRLPPDELADIMDRREVVEESSDRALASRLLEATEEATEEQMDILGKALDERDCRTAKLALLRLKYHDGMRAACERRLEELKS